MAATLTQDDIDLIVAGVLGADPRVFAIQGEITGDLEIERFGAISLTFTENTDPNIASSIVAGGENAELAAQIDALEAQVALIKEKTDQITPEGVVQVSEASQGRIPDLEAYVFAFYLSTGHKATGIANTLSANWRKDGVTESLADTTAQELEDGKYFFNLSEAERTFQWGAVLLPESSNPDIEVVSLKPIYGMLESLIWNKAKLIGTLAANDATVQPAANKLTGPYIIGDDYLDATGNAISVTVTVAFQPSTCFLAFENEKGTLFGPIAGVVDSYTDGVADLHFDLPKASTEGVLSPGPHDYSIEIRGSGANEVTIMHSKIAGQKVIWLRKFT